MNVMSPVRSVSRFLGASLLLAGALAATTQTEAAASTGWQVQPSPNVGITSSVLTGVAAASATDAWAVGQYYNGAAYQTLIEHWDGTAWVVQSSPNVGSNTNVLYGVAATSGSDAWAVGDYTVTSTSGGPGHRTLIEHCC